jgi:phosphoheptose isomerase
MTEVQKYIETVHQSLDYVNDMFSDTLNMIIATVFSCIQLDKRVILCATYNNIPICDSFAQELNNIFIQKTGKISVYSLNSDSRNLALLKRGDPAYIFSAQFDMVSHEGDLLMLVPGENPANSRPDPSEPALVKLIERAHANKSLIINLSSSSTDSFIADRLGCDSINLNFSAVSNQDAASLVLMYVLQSITRTIRHEITTSPS